MLTSMMMLRVPSSIAYVSDARGGTLCNLLIALDGMLWFVNWFRSESYTAMKLYVQRLG